MAKDLTKTEEHYILRVNDPELAKRLRSVLRTDDADPAAAPEILFEDSPVTGKLRFEGKEYQLTVLHLPCVTESYQTYDDVNLVKTTDVGQVLVVGAITEEEAQTGEARNGITPPMRNARQRLFRKPIDVGSRVVHRVEQQLLTVIQGGAPDGYKFVDHEEIWQINESTGRGEWVPVKRQ